MVNLLLESKIISINTVLLVALAVKRILKNKDFREVKILEYFCLLLFFLVPLMSLDNKVAINISVTALGGFVACLSYPHLMVNIKGDELRQKKRALQKIPFLFIVIFFTMSNHVELIYAYIFAGLVIITLKRNLAGALFSLPLLLSGFIENSAIMGVLVTISFSIGIYLFEDKNA